MAFDPDVLHAYLPSLLIDIEGFTLAQKGAYLDVLVHFWKNGPQDTDSARALCGEHWSVLRPQMAVGKSGKLSFRWLELVRAHKNKTEEEREADRIASLEKKKEKFRAECRLVHEKHKILSNAEVKRFFSHWSQYDKRSPKLHWEKEKTFEIKARMESWSRSPYRSKEEKTPATTSPEGWSARS